VTSAWTDDLVPGGPTPPRAGAPGPARPPGGIIALVVVLMLGLLAVPAASLVRGGRSFWPKKWDTRLAPIAARDEAIRGLDYEHPVPVRFLGEAAFKKLVGDNSGITDADRAEIRRQAGTFRALGFISGKVDLLKVETQAQEAGVLAFYDFNKREIVIRGTKMNVSLRATLSHELTHVLQDQHFDLSAIEDRADKADEHTGGSAQGMLALIEGDANNVMRQYLRGLSPGERTKYDAEQRAQGRDFAKAGAGVPPFVDLLYSAPYQLGPLTIRVLVASGGNSAVNAALTGPIPTSADFVEAGLVAAPPPDLAEPGLEAGERPVGKPESFGAFELYLMLAARGSPVRALTAADAVEGGRARGVSRNGTYCYRAIVQTRDTRAAAYVTSAVRDWETGATGAAVSRAGSRVTFTACDPGKRAVAPSNPRLDAAELLLGGRAGLVVGAAESGLPAVTARCVARLFAASPNAIDLLGQLDNSPPPALTRNVQARVRREALECRDDPAAGLL
jgi:hypothetical protein